jgi:hypothetical protein
MVVNKEFVFDLDALVLKGGGGAIYKRVRVFQLNYNRVIGPFGGWGALLGSYIGLV